MVRDRDLLDPADHIPDRHAAVGAIALISVGNLSGFIGPYVIGMVRDRTGLFTGSLFRLAGSSLIAAVLIAVMAISDRRPVAGLQAVAKS
ncbi:hypothetical protein [Rhodopila sp.]|uniref:hypothetical protein n=1 Tax=Rhodopila sp. TaxID=2480087 RepID=UPI003D0F7704